MDTFKGMLLLSYLASLDDFKSPLLGIEIIISDALAIGCTTKRGQGIHLISDNNLMVLKCFAGQ